jgi:hypothetical protein
MIIQESKPESTIANPVHLRTAKISYKFVVPLDSRTICCISRLYLALRLVTANSKIESATTAAADHLRVAVVDT